MGTHPIFESDFDCLTDMLSLRALNQAARRGFFTAKPIISVKDQVDMYGPTSIRKIELETFEAGFDIFSQYDDNVPVAPVGEGSRDNPYVVPTRNQGRVVLLDSSCEAPGVEGIGAPLKPFWVWQDGDG